jgi:hypothetical protein
MKVYGIDFTSAPKKWKHITCANCTLENVFLYLNEIKNLENFEEFDDFLTNGIKSGVNTELSEDHD